VSAWRRCLASDPRRLPTEAASEASVQRRRAVTYPFSRTVRAPTSATSVHAVGVYLALVLSVGEKRFVYVIRSTATGQAYIGLTSDFAKRLAAHNAGQNVSTARARPWRAVTVTEFDSEASAAKFEKYLKSGSGRAFVRTHFRI
jgi:putative endonuclease